MPKILILRRVRIILRRLTIPNTVMSIGEGALLGCNELTDVSLPFIGAGRGMTGTYDSVFGWIFGSNFSPTAGATQQFYKSSGACFYYIPSSVSKVTITDETVVPYGAFYNCSNITFVNITGNIMRINESVFYGCTNLKDLKIIQEQ